MDNLGAVAGPLAALALVAAFGVRSAIALSALPGLLAAVAIAYAIRAAPQARTAERAPLRLKVRPLLGGPLGRLMIGVSTFELGNLAATIMILRATQLPLPARRAVAATTTALLLYTGYNVAAAASVPAGRASDRWTSPGVLMAGVALFTLAYAGLAIVGPSAPALAACFLTAGVAIGCVETAEHTAVALLAPAALRGSAFGLLAVTQSLGNVVASGTAGLLWTLISPTAAFSYAAVCMLLSALALSGSVGALGSRAHGRP